VAGLELTGVRLGEDIDALEPFHRGHRVPVGDDHPEGGAVVRPQRFAVHEVGDHDAGVRIGHLCQRQRPDEGQIIPTGFRENRIQVIGAVVGSSNRTSTPSLLGPAWASTCIQQDTLTAVVVHQRYGLN
jgi:hypothetical protein